ncbi:NADH-quinone oxidoreductase subunit NuoE [Candidatus Magnetominusculus dajiuhuensis]|uniref:NADH-quinone oxidoreductase subunit NuoE n=1 Tax=Candidatus Magnetominusculus dajiuhuensis TaxID=3137712 RepID=UPI003B42E6AE
MDTTIGAADTAVVDKSRRLKDKIKVLKKLYPHTRSVLLPVLYAAQELYGWLSEEALESVSRLTGVPSAEVKGVVTFYSLYKTRPMGRHVIYLCTNVACLIMGADTLEEFLENTYGLSHGGTTADGRFSLVIMECIGACDKAPAMLVNDDCHFNLTIDNIKEILENYK